MYMVGEYMYTCAYCIQNHIKGVALCTSTAYMCVHVELHAKAIGDGYLSGAHLNVHVHGVAAH